MEDLEQIMRKIHVLFAKCEPYGAEEDNRIIVPKKEVFRLLEQLNYAVAAMQDAYECTAESRERGMNEYKRKGEKMLQIAQEGADDVYAASLIYTDNMIYELADLMTAARQSLRDDYARFVKCIEEQEKILAANQEEVKEQLRAMAEGEKYLRLIRRENARLNRINDLRNAFFEPVEEEAWSDEEDWEDEDEEDESEDESSEGESVDAGGEETEAGDENKKAAEGSKDASETEDTIGAAQDGSAKAANEKSVVQSAAAKKPSSGKKKKKKPVHPVPDLEAEWEEEMEQKKVRNIGSAVYQDVGQSYDAPVKKVSYEVRVNQAYFDQLEATVDLDAEYYQWKEEQEAAQNGETVAAQEQETLEKPEKAGKNRRKFGKRKK